MARVCDSEALVPTDLDLLPPPMTRAPELWGRDIGILFPDRGVGPAPTTVTPWPQASKTRQGLFDRSAVAAALACPPPPAAIDPRLLWCSQPGLTWGGVDHYLRHDTYARTGTTWADQGEPGNLRPVVYVRHAHDGRRGIILSGHHRSAAALLAGRPVLGIVVDGETAGDRQAEARMVTERLFVGEGTGLPHVAVGDAAEAARLIGAGDRALVPTSEVAVAALVAQGVDRPTARWRVAQALVDV